MTGIVPITRNSLVTKYMDNIKNMKLAMTILARDEGDIIEHNIRFHAAAGVDKFVVTDNSSLDGTREILAELSKEFDIKIFDEPSLTIDQDRWVTRMANWLRENDDSDWVINNDADEFWLTDAEDLRKGILETVSSASSDVGVLTCRRQNMIASKETTAKQDYQFHQNNYAVIRNIDSDCNETAWSEKSGNIIIRKLPGKVITRLEGLKSIGMGNHGAAHLGSKAECRNIEIFHYPIRSFEQFEKKVVNYGSSLEKNERFSPAISSHLRHWYECYKAGTLREQYDLFVLPEQDLVDLQEKNILRNDFRIHECFARQHGLAA